MKTMFKQGRVLLAFAAACIFASTAFGNFTDGYMKWKSTDATELVIPYLSGSDTISRDTSYYYTISDYIDKTSAERGLWVGIDASKAHCLADNTDSLFVRIHLVDFAGNKWLVAADSTGGNTANAADTMLFGVYLSKSLWSGSNFYLEKFYYLTVEAWTTEDTVKACTLRTWLQALDYGD